MLANIQNIPLIQPIIGTCRKTNLQKVTTAIRSAKNDLKADLVCLPEFFNSPYGKEYFEEYAENGPAVETLCHKALAEVAKETGLWIVSGSSPVRSPSTGKIYNTCLAFDNQGKVVAELSKLHLFDIDIPGQFTFKESEVLSPGDRMATFEMPTSDGRQLKIGLGICYDMRFAEMSLLYTQQMGCKLLLFPGAFSTKTGPAHWELLTRARALDNQCYVGVCAPATDLNAKYISHAHSMVVDPWGSVLVDAGQEEKTVVAEVDLDRVNSVRQSLPISKQRRDDLYTRVMKP